MFEPATAPRAPARDKDSNHLAAPPHPGQLNLETAVALSIEQRK